MRTNRRTLNARYRELIAKQTENAALTYTINYAAELDTDTVSSSTWSSEDSGVTIANDANTTTQTSCRLSGDTGRFRVVNKVVTTNGDIYERYIDLRIIDNSKYYWPDFGLWAGYRW